MRNTRTSSHNSSCLSWSCTAVCCLLLQVSLSGDVPVGLHGGPLLGVALKRMTSSGAELSGEDASPVLQFYSWNGISKVRFKVSQVCTAERYVGSLVMAVHERCRCPKRRAAGTREDT